MTADKRTDSSRSNYSWKRTLEKRCLMYASLLPLFLYLRIKPQLTTRSAPLVVQLVHQAARPAEAGRICVPHLQPAARLVGRAVQPRRRVLLLLDLVPRRPQPGRALPEAQLCV